MNIYTSEFLHYYRNQPNKKKLESPTHTGREVNLSCGDDLTFELKIVGGKVVEAGYHGEGCAICEGSASILSEYISGKSLKDIRRLEKDKFLSLLGIDLTSSRQKCALISYIALNEAIK